MAFMACPECRAQINADSVRCTYCHWQNPALAVAGTGGMDERTKWKWLLAACVVIPLTVAAMVGGRPTVVSTTTIAAATVAPLPSPTGYVAGPTATLSPALIIAGPTATPRLATAAPAGTSTAAPDVAATVRAAIAATVAASLPPVAPLATVPAIPVARPLRALSSDTYTDDSIGHRYVVGEVENSTARPVAYVKVVATLYDAQGRVIDTASTYTEPKDIPAGGRSAFRIIFLQMRPGYVRHEVAADGDFGAR